MYIEAARTIFIMITLQVNWVYFHYCGSGPVHNHGSIIGGQQPTYLGPRVGKKKCAGTHTLTHTYVVYTYTDKGSLNSSILGIDTLTHSHLLLV